MIRSTNISAKFSNTNKKNDLINFINEYEKVTKFFINHLWNSKDIPKLIPKEITSQADTWITKRAIQASAKQASSIIRGTRQKQKQRVYIYNQLLKQKFYKKARKLKRIIEKKKISKPEIKNLNPELDSRFIKIENSKTSEFDGWITLNSLGNKMKIIIPFKKTKHLNKLNNKGSLKQFARLSRNQISLVFDIPDKVKTSGKTIGIDIGIKNVISCSNNFQSHEDIHGWNLDKIQKKICLKKKGSKGFQRCQDHRKNYINWSINQLNLSNIKQVNIEDIKYLRYKKRTSRFMNHFVYANIFDKLEQTCEDSGVQIHKVVPTYSSQRCSACGWVRKRNRNGKEFKCTKCGFIFDADLNASRNIALPLIAISKQQRLRHENRKGFYWNAKSQEPIVPGAQRPSFHIFQ